jgi:hypothetical protein
MHNKQSYTLACRMCHRVPYAHWSQDISLNANMLNKQPYTVNKRRFCNFLRLSMGTTIHHHKNDYVMNCHTIPQSTQMDLFYL